MGCSMPKSQKEFRYIPNVSAIHKYVMGDPNNRKTLNCYGMSFGIEGREEDDEGKLVQKLEITLLNKNKIFVDEKIDGKLEGAYLIDEDRRIALQNPRSFENEYFRAISEINSLKRNPKCY